MVDGHVVPRPAAQLLAEAEGLALIAGANADEGEGYARAAPPFPREGDDAAYAAYVRGPMRAAEGLEALTDEELETLLALYPPAGAEPPAPTAKAADGATAPEKRDGVDAGEAAAAPLTGNRLNLAQIVSDAHFWCPTLAAARALPDQDKAFLYSFRYAQRPCPADAAAASPPPTYRGGDRDPSRSFGNTPAGLDTEMRAAEVPYIFHDRLRGDCRRRFTEVRQE